DEHAVLVAAAAAPLVGLRRGAHQDEGRDSGGLVDRRILVVEDGNRRGGLARAVVLVVGRIGQPGRARLGRRRDRGRRLRSLGLLRCRVHRRHQVGRGGDGDDGNVLVRVVLLEHRREHPRRLGGGRLAVAGRGGRRLGGLARRSAGCGLFCRASG